MAESLYLLETRAARNCTCEGCGKTVSKGALHFRHDPFPPARIHRGLKVTHWCYSCITSADPGPKEMVTRRIRIPITRVRAAAAPSELGLSDMPLWQPVVSSWVGIGSVLAAQLGSNPDRLHELTPAQFEEFVCDRLYAMGLEPKQIGATNRKDGGVDVLFWPRRSCPFPFLGAAQIKHHGNPTKKEGPSSVRDFAGVVAGHAFNAGLLVTNTSFTADAHWFAQKQARLLRLRDFADLKRWLVSNFTDDAEWREIPRSVELCPGVVVKLG